MRIRSSRARTPSRVKRPRRPTGSLNALHAWRAGPGGLLPRNAPGRVLRRAGVDWTVRGFRSSARSWMAESGIPAEVAEACRPRAPESATGVSHSSVLLLRTLAWTRDLFSRTLRFRRGNDLPCSPSLAVLDLGQPAVKPCVVVSCLSRGWRWCSCRVRLAGKTPWPDGTRSWSPRWKRISPISGACAHPAVRRGALVLSGARGLVARGGSHAQAQSVLRAGTGGSGGRPSRFSPVHGEAGSEGPSEARAGPERGVVEVKGVGDDAWLTAESDQVSRYWDRYRLVLVTNLRDFVLVGADGEGRAGQARSLPPS